MWFFCMILVCQRDGGARGVLVDVEREPLPRQEEEEGQESVGDHLGEHELRSADALTAGALG
jgi:hypothetical protein